MSRELIIRRFMENVYGKQCPNQSVNISHDGSDGHWLERAMNIQPNADNSPDIFGFEMKIGTKTKTTFGDWSADFYLYKNNVITRSKFIRTFGKPNIEKRNRYSWSGEPIPKINRPSPYNGSKIVIDPNHEYIYRIIYNYNLDPRENKKDIVPEIYQTGDIILAGWTKQNLKSKLEDKFGQHGWFKITKNQDGFFNKIHFGQPMNFENWINLVQRGIVFLDSGMYEGNSRNYSQWRANNNYWDSLIVYSYPE